jgi:hypothetical protein
VKEYLYLPTLSGKNQRSVTFSGLDIGKFSGPLLVAVLGWKTLSFHKIPAKIPLILAVLE